MDFVDLLLHVDQYLMQLVAMYGPWIYAILFLIVFAETGLIVTPFLPGDSLLFAAGALGAAGVLDARVAAICVAHAVEALLTRDRDFSLFPELVVRNPFADAARPAG